MKTCVEVAYRRYVDRIGKPPGPMLDDDPEVVRRHRAHVAVGGGEIVGVMVLIEEAGGILLDNVAVRPDRQRAGLGRRLIALAETTARDLGYEALDL